MLRRRVRVEERLRPYRVTSVPLTWYEGQGRPRYPIRISLPSTGRHWLIQAIREATGAV